ncbi:MAG: hypothetical protein IJL97_02020 [Lachnospiraceae bacterium]|nr:hypothetical protein [Lachnospiraceae bacterium]
MKKRHVTIILALLLTAAMLLGGCSSGTTETEGAKETAAQAEDPQTESIDAGQSLNDDTPRYYGLNDMYQSLKTDPSIEDLKYEDNKISFTLDGVYNEIVEEWISDTEVVWHTKEGDKTQDMTFTVKDGVVEAIDGNDDWVDSWTAEGGAGTVYSEMSMDEIQTEQFSAISIGYIFDNVRAPEPAKGSIVIKASPDRTCYITETREYAKEELPDVALVYIGFGNCAAVFEKGEPVLLIPTYTEYEGSYAIDYWNPEGADLPDDMPMDEPAETCFLFYKNDQGFYSSELRNASSYDIKELAKTPFAFDTDTDKFYGIDKEYIGYMTNIGEVLSSEREDIKAGKEICIHPADTGFVPEAGKSYKLEGYFENCDLGLAFRVTSWSEAE